jgi:hypothetical protein
MMAVDITTAIKKCDSKPGIAIRLLAFAQTALFCSGGRVSN